MLSDIDLKTRLALGKIPVVQLNQQSDFTRWHVALRKLVGAYGMGNALLFTVPKSELAIYIDQLSRSETSRSSSSSSSSSSAAAGGGGVSTSTTTTTHSTVTATPKGSKAKAGDKERGAETKETKDGVRPADPAAAAVAPVVPDPDGDARLMKLLGVTRAQDEFFSSSTTFYNTRLMCDEKEPESYYRTEVWHWMEASLSKGQYRSVAKNITPVYDIKKLYAKICELADKATIISCINEYKKIFTLQVKDDLFVYHEELQQQLRLVKAQVEALGLVMTLPVDIEQNLMLIAAWHHPQYREIAEEISRKERAFTLDELLRDLQRQRLLAIHLNGSSSIEKEKRTEQEVRVKAAKEATPKRCFAFQKGTCTRESCPYLHERSDAGKGNAAVSAASTGGKPSQNAPPSEKKKKICSACKKRGHHESVCRSKLGGKAAMASAEEDVTARICDGYMSSDDDHVAHASVLVADDAPVEAGVTARQSFMTTRWCVDSGANRDICGERHLFKGELKPKAIRIGEAGQGHSFSSQGEGAIPLHVRGKELPLFTRTLFAEQVSENIMSVPEAVDRGFAMFFHNRGVEIYNADEVKLDAKPVLRPQDPTVQHRHPEFTSH